MGMKKWGGWPEVTRGLHAHACIPKRGVPSVLNAGVCASSIPIVLKGQSDQARAS